MPAGAAGEIAYPFDAGMVPPELVIVYPTIDAPRVMLSNELESAIVGGVIATISEKVACELPTVFVAVTVYVVRPLIVVGVPERIPLTASKVVPAGAAGERVNDVGIPPELDTWKPVI